MTREEAIHILDNIKPKDVDCSLNAYIVGKAITMAIKALEQERKAITNQEYIATLTPTEFWKKIR